MQTVLAALVLGYLAWTPGAYPQDTSLRLDRLERLSYASSRENIRAAIEQLEADLDQTNTRQRIRFALVKARSEALRQNNARALELVDGVLADRAALAPDLELRALNLATGLLVLDDRFETGFEYFREALALAPGVAAARVRADTYRIAADFHARIGEYATAIEYANQAIDQVSPEQAPRSHCVAYERRARARFGLGQTDRAEADYRASIELCDSIPDAAFAAVARIGLAGVLLGRDRSEQAESNLMRAIEMLSRNEFTDSELEARHRLAGLMLDQNRVQAAKQVIAPALNWLDRPGSHAVRAGVLELRARIAAVEGDKQSEYGYKSRAIEFKRHHTARLRDIHFSLLMSAQNDRARRRETELLRSENALAQLDRQNRSQDEIALTIGAVGAIATGILLLALLIKAGRDRREFQRHSQRDGLTGLYNHTRFFELAQQAFQRSRQTAMPFSLIVSDVDLFKQVNDDFGHLVGDSVLERIGSRMRAAFGSNAIIGRLGGEEFGIALIDCDTDTAVARVEHFRATLNRRRSGEDEPSITMSFGVAELSRERTLDELYARADQALYDAKDAGRNRVITVARINLGGSAFVT